MNVFPLWGCGTVCGYHYYSTCSGGQTTEKEIVKQQWQQMVAVRTCTKCTCAQNSITGSLKIASFTIIFLLFVGKCQMVTTYNTIVGRNESNMYLHMIGLKRNLCFWKFAEAVPLLPPWLNIAIKAAYVIWTWFFLAWTRHATIYEYTEHSNLLVYTSAGICSLIPHSYWGLLVSVIFCSVRGD